ncbi:hypothetical protein HPP92_000093 [Vanilla planifolia]|uniref:Uncharacterized protein n=1 Tax=Vanilla planifolia TaxID=51239 RepID=A0A835S1E0_VANPL|nr:hypothetical protein HPP92_000083 [Vanilla planifolia]KAG0500021.1 hypothetical protein HPP92_000093 [Vanilla planifolia]
MSVSGANACSGYHPLRRANPNRLLRRLPTDSFSPIVNNISAGKRSLDIQAVTKDKPRVFFLDVNPICYRGSERSLHTFVHWLSLFFSEISHRNPLIAVLDGEDGNEFRRKLLPSYKSNRQSIIWRGGNLQRGSSAGASSTELQVTTILQKCNVPVGFRSKIKVRS